jgi:hypothetical protein
MGLRHTLKPGDSPALRTEVNIWTEPSIGERYGLQFFIPDLEEQGDVSGANE